MSAIAGGSGGVPDAVRSSTARFLAKCHGLARGYLQGLSLPEKVTLPVLYHHEFPEKPEHPLITVPVYIGEGLLGCFPGGKAADGSWSGRAHTLASEYGIGRGVLHECLSILSMDEEFVHAFFECQP
jgi:hypothetical protein